MTEATINAQSEAPASANQGKVSIHPLAEELESPQHWLLLDVRTPFEFKESRIKDSWNVPLHDLPKHMEKVREHAEGKRVAVICRSGTRASAARKAMLKANIDADIRVMEGGIAAWAREGKPLLYGRGGISLERQVRMVAGSMGLIGTLLGAFVSPLFLIIPGFIGAGLTFAGITNTCGMAKILMRMPFNRLKQLANCPLQSGEPVEG